MLGVAMDVLLLISPISQSCRHSQRSIELLLSEIRSFKYGMASNLVNLLLLGHLISSSFLCFSLMNTGSQLFKYL
jgi:hypothetical protein